MCDCASEDDGEPRIRPTANDNSRSDDCTSEDPDSEPKIQICKSEIATNDLQANDSKSCGCTSESSAKTTESCVCTSESSAGTTKSCDCTSGEESNERKMKICDAATADDRDHSKSPYAIVQVELSRSMLNLLPSAESSTSCDCERSRHDSEDLPTCSSRDGPSCDCTSESSEWSSSKAHDKEKRSECTLAMIKPEAMIFRDEIERTIEEEGFGIRQRRWLHLTAEQASEFYRDNDERPEFARLIAYMSAKPMAVYVLSKLDAITEWRLLIGPTKVTEARVYAPDSIRGRYGSTGDDMQNAVHGSFDARAAEREIHFFFPDCTLEPLLRGESAEEYLRKRMNEVLSEGLAKCCEEKPEDPVAWLGNWLLNGRRPECP